MSFPDPIPGIIPFGTLTVFAGASGSGKSTMLDEWMVRWRDARTICGHPTCRPTAQYLLIADRRWDEDHSVWFRVLGWPDVPRYCLAEETVPDYLWEPSRAVALFTYCLDQLRPIPGSHVFVDPMTPLFVAGDPNAQRPVARTLLQFNKLCAKYSINITVTAYFGKQKADHGDRYTRPVDRIAGSGAFAGYSHCQIYITEPEPPDHPAYILGWKPRHAAEAEFSFARDPSTGLFVPFELFTELDKQEAVCRAIPETPIATTPLLARIRTAVKMSEATAERYLTKLVTDGRVTRIRKGLYRRLPPS